MRDHQLRGNKIRRQRQGRPTLLYLLSLAEENGHDEGMWKANPCAVNESVSGAFNNGKVLGILGVFDEALYGRQC